MKKHPRMFLPVLVILLIATTISVSAASLDFSAAQQPWSTFLFKDSEDGVTNLSTAFVGDYRLPMLSYSLPGQPMIFQAFKATKAMPGTCGQNFDWSCTAWKDDSLVPGSVSNLATHQYIDTHTTNWAYMTTYGKIRAVFIERKHDMTIIDSGWDTLLDIGKFGTSLIGSPSLHVDSGGRYRMAVTIQDSLDTYPYSLVYVRYVGGSNNSCTNSGSPYQCDVIDTSLGFNSMGPASLDIAEDGTVGIAYNKLSEIIYAYPHLPGPGSPSNCGPGGLTWRCVSIFSAPLQSTLGSVVKLAMGREFNQRGILFTWDDPQTVHSLLHANYVGSNGNCGWELYDGVGDYRWDCFFIVNYNFQNSGSFSIDIDPEGFSVVAYDHASADLGNRDLYIAYPRARIGEDNPTWRHERIDGAPVYGVSTGAQAAITLADTGIGFIGYLQQADYEADDLKIASQSYRTLIPILTKP